VLGLLTLSPVLAVLLASFRPSGLPLADGWTLRHYVEVWSDGATYFSLLQTLVFAAASSTFAISVSAALAWFMERSDMPGASYLRAGILVAMVTPPILFAIGWVLLLSPKIGLFRVLGFDIYTLPGMILVQALAMVPTSFLILAPMIRNMNPSLEDAASMSGATHGQVLRRVTLPLLLPALLSAGTLLMIAATLSLDIPLIIGLPARSSLLSLDVYRLMQPVSGIPAYGSVAAINNVMFVGLALAMVIYHRATRQAERFATVTGKGFRTPRVRLGAWRWPSFAGVSLYFVAALALPFLALLWVSLVPFFSGFDPTMFGRLSLENFTAVFGAERVRNSAIHSAVVASCAAIAASLLALVVSWIVVRSRVRWKRLLDVLAMLPIGTSALMMGIALVFIFFGFRAIPIYGSVWIIVIGHVIVYLPFSSRTIQAAMLQLNRELEEAAHVAGASVLNAFRRVLVPLLAPALVGVLIWVGFHSLREFSVAVILQSGRNEVLSTVLYSYWNSGKAQYATAIAVMLMVFLGILVLFAGRLTSHRVEA